MIEIFCEIPLSDVNKFTYKSIRAVVEILGKMFQQKPNLTHRFKMNNVEYGFIPKLDDMSFGEYVDLDTYSNSWDEMDKAMAVLYRPVKQSFKNSYLIEDYDTVKEVSMSKMPLDVAMGAIFFLYNLKKELMRHILTYSKGELMRANTQQHHNLQPDGDGIQACINYLKEIPQNLKVLNV